MAHGKSYLTGSFIAGADLSSKQYYLMRLVTAQDSYVRTAAASENFCIGPLMNKPDSSGEGAEIAIAGIAKVKLGGQTTSGTPIVANSSGLGVSLTSTEGIPVGRCVHGGSTSDIVPVLLHCTSRVGSEFIDYGRK